MKVKKTAEKLTPLVRETIKILYNTRYTPVVKNITPLNMMSKGKIEDRIMEAIDQEQIRKNIKLSAIEKKILLDVIFIMVADINLECDDGAAVWEFSTAKIKFDWEKINRKIFKLIRSMVKLRREMGL